MTVDMKELSHRETDGCSEFYNTQMSAGFQYSAHLRETFVEIGEVADAEGCCHSVEGAIGIGESRTILFLKRDNGI